MIQRKFNKSIGARFHQAGRRVIITIDYESDLLACCAMLELEDYLEEHGEILLHFPRKEDA